MTEAKQHAGRLYRRHANVIAYVLLAIGVVVAIAMIQNEVRDRTADDRQIEVRLDESDRARISENERTIGLLRKQIDETQRINKIQNQILRALLAAEKRDPELFGGVDLPRLSALLEARAETTATRTLEIDVNGTVQDTAGAVNDVTPDPAPDIVVPPIAPAAPPAVVPTAPKPPVATPPVNNLPGNPNPPSKPPSTGC